MMQLLILKEDMRRLLDMSCQAEGGIAGVCVYRKSTETFPFSSVEGIAITGQGKADADTGVLSVINAFLGSNPNYGYVGFCTQDVETVTKHGDFYWYRFSYACKEVVREKAMKDPTYMHMFLTPERAVLVRYDSKKDSVVSIPPPVEMDAEVFRILSGYIPGFNDCYILNSDKALKCKNSGVLAIAHLLC